jgi:translation initiation factor IF-1
MTQKDKKNLDNKIENNSSQSRDNQIIKKEGRVIETLPNTFFKIILEDGKEILGFLSGKMRMNRITILPGDKVLVEMTPYDEGKGRIVYRLK